MKWAATNHTSKLGSFAYRWESQGKGKPRKLIVLRDIKLSSTEPTVNEIITTMAQYEFLDPDAVTLNYEHEEYYGTSSMSLSGERYATEAEYDAVKVFEAEQKNVRERAKKAQEDKERAEYERLRAKFERKD